MESWKIKRIMGHIFRGCLSLCLSKFADVYCGCWGQWTCGIQVGFCELTFWDTSIEPLSFSRKYRPQPIISRGPVTISQPRMIMRTFIIRTTSCRCTSPYRIERDLGKSKCMGSLFKQRHGPGRSSSTKVSTFEKWTLR